MLAEVVGAANALDALATALSSQVGGDQPYFQVWGGWNIPPISRTDLVLRINRLALRLRQLDERNVDGPLKAQLIAVPGNLAWFQANSLPQLSGANAPIVIGNLLFQVSNIEQAIHEPNLDWETISKSDLVPKALMRRIRQLESTLNALEPRAGDLSSKVDAIDQAHTAALDLPTDLESLREARAEMSKLEADAKGKAQSIDKYDAEAANARSNILKQEEAAKALIKNIDSAYSAATSIGLAASFTERAQQLSRSTWIWVSFLVATLLVGGFLGNSRLLALQGLVATKGVNTQWIWLNAGMSILSLAAPIWFAWLATRQIGQRFRLAEDYGFKASIARAYEGYRKEAARLNPDLENRLFASALDRLEEAPLRFLSTEDYSSPYEALFASPGFQKIIDKFPGSRNEFMEFLSRFAPGKAAESIKAEDMPTKAAD